MASHTFIDPAFGELTLDHEEWWIAQIPLTPKHPVKVLVDPGEPPREQYLVACRATYHRIRQNELEFRLATAERLCERYNLGWRPADEPEQTPMSFTAKLRLTSIRLHGEGHAQLHYNEDCCFGGHFITAWIHGDGSLYDADFEQ